MTRGRLRAKLFSPGKPRPTGARAYLVAAGAVLVIAAFCYPLLGHLELANIAMLFPLAVLFTAIHLGRGPAVLAAFLSVALVDFLFVPPHFTFAVSDLQYLLTFIVLLAVALIAAHLADRLRQQRDEAERREAQASALYELARELSAALSAEQIAEIAARTIEQAFGLQSCIVTNEGVVLGTCERSPADSPPRENALGFPLTAPMRERGTLQLWPESALPATEEARALIGTIATLIAISLERVHYEEVARATEVEMASERLRNSVLGALSHDLRTPLTALVGLAETLALTRPALSGEQRELADAIRDEAMRTTLRVNKLLELARLQSGKLRLRREWQPIEEVVGAALGAMKQALTRHRMELDLPQDLPLVEIDAVLFERVLCNLLENAVRHTPPGSCIGIAARADAAWLELSVSDQGPGIAVADPEALFARFARGDAEAAGGVGLGLTIARTIVEAHGGRIVASNRPAGGACFTIRLPLGEPPAMPAEATEAA